MGEDLVGGEGFAVDASLIAADANEQRSVPGEEWQADADAGRAVQEHLAPLDDAAFGAASGITPKFISQSDPAAQWTGAHKGHEGGVRDADWTVRPNVTLPAGRYRDRFDLANWANNEVTSRAGMVRIEGRGR